MDKKPFTHHILYLFMPKRALWSFVASLRHFPPVKHFNGRRHLWGPVLFFPLWRIGGGEEEASVPQGQHMPYTLSDDL